jgi:hypothetical protein
MGQMVNCWTANEYLMLKNTLPTTYKTSTARILSSLLQDTLLGGHIFIDQIFACNGLLSGTTVR